VGAPPTSFYEENVIMGDADRLWGILEPWLDAEGVELDDLDVLGRGAGRVVRVTVDSDGGLDLDRISDISRGLSRILDDDELIAGSFTLEVTSPGLERSLRRPAHYRKAVGREVVVKTSEPIEGAKSHRGILEGVEDDRVLVSVDGSSRFIPFNAVAQARTVFRWEKAPKPGKRGAK
jgi:ribosome maturation factor RimP